MNQTTLVLGLAMFAFIMTVIWGAPLLRVLRHFKVGKVIRVDEPGHHNVKMGTPTMGGVLFVLPVLLLPGLLNAAALMGLFVTGCSVLVPLIVMVSYGALGALDDWEGIRGKRRGEGMRARTKFAAQVILAVGTAFVLKYLLDVPDMRIPGIKGDIPLGIWYNPVAASIIVSESNAVGDGWSRIRKPSTIPSASSLQPGQPGRFERIQQVEWPAWRLGGVHEGVNVPERRGRSQRDPRVSNPGDASSAVPDRRRSHN